MEGCLGLENPFLFFVQLSHSVIKVAPSITRLTNLYVISPPTLFPKMLVALCFFFNQFLACFKQKRVSPHWQTFHQLTNYGWFLACVWAALYTVSIGSSLHSINWEFSVMRLSHLTHKYRCRGQESIPYCSYSVELAWEAQLKTTFPSSCNFHSGSIWVDFGALCFYIYIFFLFFK